VQIRSYLQRRLQQANIGHDSPDASSSATAAAAGAGGSSNGRAASSAAFQQWLAQETHIRQADIKLALRRANTSGQFSKDEEKVRLGRAAVPAGAAYAAAAAPLAANAGCSSVRPTTPVADQKNLY
jgi:hypothetical protein